MPPVFAPFIRDADFAVRRSWSVPERRLLDYLLVYVEEGECRFTVEGHTYELARGDFCLVQPGERVRLEGFSATVTPYAHFDLAYNPRREESFATRPGQMNLEAHAELLQPRLRDLGPAYAVDAPARFRVEIIPSLGTDFAPRWLRVVRLWNAGGDLARVRADNLLGALILELTQALSQAEPARGDSSLSWIPSYLSTRLADSVTVDEMAGRAGLSPSRFHHVFRAAFGVTPGRYLWELRARHAAELLETTAWTQAHIAGLCGYADVHHFARAFKRLRGVTPGEHRRRAGTPWISPY